MRRPSFVSGCCALVVAAGLAACSTDTGPSAAASRLTERLAAGANFTCALDHAGAAFCWGEGASGQLGNGAAFESPMPVRVDGGPYLSLAAGGDAACGLHFDFSVDCWGVVPAECCGQATGPFTTPTPVVAPVGFSHVSLGAGIGCGIGRSSDTYCWGSELLGALGNGEQSDTAVPPARVAGHHRFVSVSAGVFGGCGLDAAGAAWCWGANLFGELGTGSADDNAVATEPVAVTGGSRFAQITVGAAYACGITTSGTTACWGVNDAGQLGTGNGDDQTAPAPVAASGFVAVFAGGKNNVLDHTCALDASGAASCWGADDQGQLGAAAGATCASLQPVPCAMSPVAVERGLAFTTLALGDTHTCGMVADGHVYCWGLNSSGQLGDGTTTTTTTPVLSAFTP
ncbi:MAG TPA: hypothetical protein VIC24_06540 [Gemmatimonadaceae bacterium]|jgi:alpha-tubulin suppressor-like RCC1 family protein